MVLESGKILASFPSPEIRSFYSRSDFVDKISKSSLVNIFSCLAHNLNFHLEKSIYQLFLEFANRSFISGF